VILEGVGKYIDFFLSYTYALFANLKKNENVGCE
jgi:hypothetical protein